MNHKLLILLACVLISSISFAQKDFRPGYIIKNGDTLRGLVQNRGKKNFKSTVFKTNKQAAPTTYTPAEVEAYGFNGERQYESIDLDTTSGSRRIFGQRIADGAIDLYYLKDKSDKVILVKGNQLSVVERKPDAITTGKVNKYSETQAVFKHDVGYVQTLNMAVADCGLSANSLKFSPTQVTRLVDEYNRCKKDFTIVKDTRPRTTIGGSLAGGWFQSNFLMRDYQDADLKADGFFGEVNFEVRFPKRLERMTFVAGLQVVTAKYSAVTYSSPTVRNEYFLDLSYTKVPLSAKYSFATPNGSLFLRGGGSISFMNNVKFSGAKIYIGPDGNPSYQTNLGSGNKVKDALGILAGIGYDMKLGGRLRVFAELRQEFNKGVFGQKYFVEGVFRSTNLLVGIGI